jgi:hypothetical protein
VHLRQQDQVYFFLIFLPFFFFFFSLGGGGCTVPIFYDDHILTYITGLFFFLNTKQTDEFRNDALHFLQSISTNSEYGVESQGLNLADLVLIQKATKRESNEGDHSMLLQSVGEFVLQGPLCSRYGHSFSYMNFFFFFFFLFLFNTH